MNHTKLVTLLSTLLLYATLSHASVVIRMDLDQLVAASDAIVEGVVEDVQSRWEEKLIFTYVTLRVDDPLKGERRRTLVVRQLGGSVGALEVHVPGMPRFAAGDAVIVFLRQADNGTFYVVGMNQGRYAIENDHAVSNLTGVDLLDPKSGRVRNASMVQRVGVEELKAGIRERLR